jgi:hypothetical protein
MNQLDIHTNWGKRLGSAETVGDCCRKYGLSVEEITYSLETGEGINDMVVSFAEEYLRHCAINSLIKYRGRYSLLQIADLLGYTHRQMISKRSHAIRKIRKKLCLG